MIETSSPRTAKFVEMNLLLTCPYEAFVDRALSVLE